MGSDERSLAKQCLAECFGTWLLTFVIVATVTSSVVTAAQSGVWQVAAPIGLGVALSIFVTADISGAHLNPAVTLAMYLFRRSDCPGRKACLFVLSQLFGGFLAGLVNLLVFGPMLQRFETSLDILRGGEESVRSAMAFVDYFPNPAAVSRDHDVVGAGTAFVGEMIGTMVLVVVIFVLTHANNKSASKHMKPLLIGATVTVNIGFFGPLTMAGFNPARDFGPRIVAAMAGWGSVAFPGPKNGFWLYIVAPCVGAVLGAALATQLYAPTEVISARYTCVDLEGGEPGEGVELISQGCRIVRNPHGDDEATEDSFDVE
eukprot:PLAT5625.1.p1 GENE.PLAT5625.1~~PLAT5625.1.p1  ORF type:complete len:331 (+),score=119.12 PLAT5625.1:44-994(+)